MQAKRINNWPTDSQLKTHLKKQNILEWLNEEGSITAKISSDAKVMKKRAEKVFKKEKQKLANKGTAQMRTAQFEAMQRKKKKPKLLGPRYKKKNYSIFAHLLKGA